LKQGFSLIIEKIYEAVSDFALESIFSESAYWGIVLENPAFK